jgi:hypothetical protein
MDISNIIEKSKAIKIMEKPSFLFHKKRDILHAELIYIPYYLFLTEIILKNDDNIKVNICIDRISGEYAFVTQYHCFDISEHHRPNLKIGMEEAKKVANRAVNQVIVAKMRQNISLDGVKIQLIKNFDYPYWLGLYKKGQKGLQFEVIDAITGKKQGPKMKPIFMEYMLHQDELNSQNKSR